MTCYVVVWPESAHAHLQLAVAKEAGRVIDGHAPGVLGDAARCYADHGITTDHEVCVCVLRCSPHPHGD